MRNNQVYFIALKLFVLVLVAGFTTMDAAGQSKYFTREGKIEFLSKAPLEDITAINKKVTCILDIESGQMEFSVLMKAFEFEKALMQEHFNENYVESDKYPKAIFKGEIKNKDSVNFAKDGAYPVTVSGKMTIHGVTNDVSYPGNIMVKAGTVSGTAEIEIKLKDYEISIPKVVKDNIAETVKVTIHVNMNPFK